MGKTTKTMSTKGARKPAKRVASDRPAKRAAKKTSAPEVKVKTFTDFMNERAAASAGPEVPETAPAEPGVPETAPVEEARGPELVPENGADMLAALHLHAQGEGAVDLAERRDQQRCEIAGELEVEVELFGYQRDAREFGIGPRPDPAKKFQTVGLTVNLSCSGMLARVQDEIEDGSHCLVRFINAGECIRPELRWGLVTRTRRDDGGCEVAVKFDAPLEHLDADGLAA